MLRFCGAGFMGGEKKRREIGRPGKIFQPDWWEIIIQKEHGKWEKMTKNFIFQQREHTLIFKMFQILSQHFNML